MSRAASLVFIGLVCLPGLAAAEPKERPKGPKSAAEAQWIWFDEGNPAVEAPAETRYFRRVFTVDQAADRPIDAASLDITADNGYTVWLNGAEVGKGSDWMVPDHYDVKAQLLHGKNVLAVEARNTDGPAGLMVRLAYTPSGKPRLALCSDATWKASKTAGENWRKLDFDDSSWTPAKALGAYGVTAPWSNVAGAPAGNPRFTVPEGFRVEKAAAEPRPQDVFSLVNMTFDAKGRLLVSQENGPILLCTDPDKDGVLQNVRPYCSLVKNCQGMCWVGDALLLVRRRPQGRRPLPLPRHEGQGRDRRGGVACIGLQRRMGDHGPHAILHGPDGFLYVVNGNHSWAEGGSNWRANSPLTRWPNGQMTPDQGKPGSAEDVLLPRLNDANGHAANLRAPGGTIWRLDPDGKNAALVSAGFRNALRRRLQPRRRAVHLRQRHGMGRKPAVVSPRAASATARRAASSAGAPARPKSRPTPSTPCRPFTTSAAARRSAWSSTNTPPSRRSTAAPISWPTGRSASSTPPISIPTARATNWTSKSSAPAPR